MHGAASRNMPQLQVPSALALIGHVLLHSIRLLGCQGWDAPPRVSTRAELLRIQANELTVLFKDQPTPVTHQTTMILMHVEEQVHL